jgi:hypothetical protein
MTWHCEDCHTVGFYWDITPEEMRKKHMNECPANPVHLGRFETLTAEDYIFLRDVGIM